MKSKQEKFGQLQASLEKYGHFEITPVNPTICAPYDDDLSEYGFRRVEWAPYIWQGENPLPKNHILFQDHRVFSIGLSSVLACLQLELKPRMRLLDMCAAPGIKSLYLQILVNNELDLYVNDISQSRLVRLRRLFQDFNKPMPIFTRQPGEKLLNKYSEKFFDAVLLDAPCSGEGTILAGDDKALSEWSLLKTKLCQQTQRSLIKTAGKLVKPDGQLIYSTCTLNERENEGTIRKAHLELDKVSISEVNNVKLNQQEAIRILPSNQSIGFFIAKIT